MESKHYQYFFMKNEDVPYGKKAKLIDFFYDSYNIYNATKAELMASKLLDEKTIDAFLEHKNKFDLEKEYYDFCNTPFSFVTIESDDFPEKLKNIYDVPYGLFYIGKLPDFKRAVSIVGARRCSAYGKKLALELGEKLGANGFTVISGMARGIDTYGHRGCLDKGGNTVAILGSGCDVIYPSENSLIYEEIVSSGGAVISEYQLGTSPLAMNFPRRNRIVSALSDIVVVIEAREKSGSLITADFALEHGKDIYVTPGRIGDSLSTGTNKLIAQGAGIICDIDLFINELLEAYGQSPKVENNKKRNLKLTEEQKMVYDLFDEYPKSLSTALEESKLDYLKLLSLVLSLEKEGILTEVFKNNYVKME
ncbi:DNA-processing protein DprA [Pseudobutyrivibrio ruminis]|uniref:DNA-processing protein DprA n=1 Tax=Pseudobutyrivibrio ruminis TaxID=46206 RepID=UPI0004252FA3|nr:DNA-processing protein DprA [Pseudobutyrivibrio ruminis]